MNKKSDYLDSLNVVFIADETIEEITNFANKYPNTKAKGLFLRDTDNEFLKKFCSSVVPNLFLYNENKLIKNLRGEFDLESMLKFAY